MIIGHTEVSLGEIEAFCRKWKIREFSLFGSIIRGDFRPDSDVDVLVSFEPGSFWGFEIVDMREELERLFDRRVDFITKEGLRNPFRRHEILTSRKVVYAA